MDQHAIVDQIKINNGAKNYKSFIHSITVFIAYYFENKSYIKYSKKSEQFIVDSLLLLEKLHMHLFYSFNIYLKYFNGSENPLHSNTNFTLLNKLQQEIRNHTFLLEENKTLCEKIIAQVLTYYPQSNSSKIKIILTPISPPWIAKL